MKVKELLIKFQEYKLEYEVLNANCAHNAAANLFMERYGIKNCFIPDVIDKEILMIKKQKTTKDMKETQGILLKMGFKNLNDNIWESEWFGIFGLAKSATPEQLAIFIFNRGKSYKKEGKGKTL